MEASVVEEHEEMQGRIREGDPSREVSRGDLRQKDARCQEEGGRRKVAMQNMI